MPRMQSGSNYLQTQQFESRQNAPIAIRFEQGCRRDILGNPLDMQHMFQKEMITDFCWDFPTLDDFIGFEI
jgi:hypothetical protein